MRLCHECRSQACDQDDSQKDPSLHDSDPSDDAIKVCWWVPCTYWLYTCSNAGDVIERTSLACVWYLLGPKGEDHLDSLDRRHTGNEQVSRGSAGNNFRGCADEEFNFEYRLRE